MNSYEKTQYRLMSQDDEFTIYQDSEKRDFRIGDFNQVIGLDNNPFSIINKSTLEDFLNSLREQFSRSETIPSVIFFQGKEIQIDNVPLAEAVAYASSPQLSVSDIVLKTLEAQRNSVLLAEKDTFEEFSDLEDDSEERELTSFERRLIETERRLKDQIVLRQTASPSNVVMNKSDTEAEVPADTATPKGRV